MSSKKMKPKNKSKVKKKVKQAERLSWTYKGMKFYADEYKGSKAA